MEEAKRAKLRAMHILEKRDKTEQELYQSLKKTGYAEESIQGAIDYVRSYGYLNDKEYARRYVECYCDRKSVRRMQFDLQKRGIDKELIEQAIENCLDLDEKQVLLKSLKKKWPSQEKPQDKDLQRLVGYLQRQGFKNDEIWRALREENLT